MKHSRKVNRALIPLYSVVDNAEMISGTAVRDHVDRFKLASSVLDEFSSSEADSEDEPSTVKAFGHADPIKRSYIVAKHSRKKNITISEEVHVTEIPNIISESETSETD